MRGAIAREERDRRFLAAMFANLINLWSKRRVTVDQLLGVKKNDFESMTDSEKKAALEAVEKKLERMRKAKK